MNWQWRSFAELKNNELYEMLALRQQVFMLEQKCFYNDLDYLDQDAMHLLGRNNDKLIAYLRLLPLHVPYLNAVSMGRVVTDKTVRGQGVSKKMLQQAFLFLEKNNNTAPIIISAQFYLKKFYESFGFLVSGEPYDEDGILHVKMIRNEKRS